MSIDLPRLPGWQTQEVRESAETPGLFELRLSAPDGTQTVFEIIGETDGEELESVKRVDRYRAIFLADG